MRYEKEIRMLIKGIEDANRHILDQKKATILINGPVCLMQLAALVRLKDLYWVLDEPMPKFKCAEVDI